MTSRANRLRVLFILGFSRSGTKLLQALLINHPGIFITHKLLFVPMLADRFSSYGDVSRLGAFRRLHEGVMATYYFAVRKKLGDERMLVYYWFMQRGRYLTNEYLVKWYIFWGSITQQRTDGALVRLVMPVPDPATRPAAITDSGRTK